MFRARIGGGVLESSFGTGGEDASCSVTFPRLFVLRATKYCLVVNFPTTDIMSISEEMESWNLFVLVLYILY